MPKRGFTLIEMVVVVAIIGLLAAVSVVGFSRQQSQARDARRASDIEKINTALQSYIEDHGEPLAVGAYPPGSGDADGWDWSSQNSGNYTPEDTQFINFLVTSGYMTKVPVDPINNDTDGATGFAYGYFYYNNGAYVRDGQGYTHYTLRTRRLESSSTANIFKEVPVVPYF